MMGVITNDHFLLGLGLATGPAIILIFAVYAFFKWGKAWKAYVAVAPDVGNVVCVEHMGLVKDIAFTASECRSIWLEIKDINSRQMTLREKLPQQYISRSDLKEIQDRLGNIDKKLDRYLELSVLKNHA